jgi:hypothetical protein
VTRLQSFVRAVGVASVAFGVVAALAPRRVAAAGGVRAAATDAALPVVVRFAAARQLSLGLALLTRHPPDAGRAARLFLPLTALDAAAALSGVRAGVLAPRAAALSLTVLAADAWVALAARREDRA